MEIITAILLSVVIYFFYSVFQKLSDKKNEEQFVKIIDCLSENIYNPNNICCNICTIGLKKLKIKFGETEELIFYDRITQEGKYLPERFRQDPNRFVYTYSIYVEFAIKDKQIQTLHIYLHEIPKQIRLYLENELQRINAENDNANNKNLNKPRLNVRSNGPISILVDYRKDEVPPLPDR